MKTYDHFEQIVGFAAFPVAIVGNLESENFELIDIIPEPPSADVTQRLSERGMSFIAAIGIVEGAPGTALAEPLDAITATALRQALAWRAEDRIKTPDRGR